MEAGRKLFWSLSGEWGALDDFDVWEGRFPSAYSKRVTETRTLLIGRVENVVAQIIITVGSCSPFVLEITVGATLLFQPQYLLIHNYGMSDLWQRIIWAELFAWRGEVHSASVAVGYPLVSPLPVNWSALWFRATWSLLPCSRKRQELKWYWIMYFFMNMEIRFALQQLSTVWCCRTIWPHEVRAPCLG